MRKKLQKTRVRRITVDEKLSDELFRFVFCFLKEDIEKFTDRDDEWQEEREKFVRPQDYSQILDVRKSDAPAWETLQEGQVYLSGEFKVIGNKAKPEYFEVSAGRKQFLRIDNLGMINEGVKALYSDVLRGS